MTQYFTNSFLNTFQGRIAYNKLAAKDKRCPFGVVFLSGFKSDKTGTKALFLEKICAELGISFVRFDYSGHGESSGEFTHGTIGQWLDDTISVIDQLTEGPQLLVGSSMGGWLMLLAALKRKERVAGLLGIASAPDFTENLIWDTLPEQAKQELKEKGIYHLPTEYCNDPVHSTYPITLELIEEGRKHLLLNREILLALPVTLLHGRQDKDVPVSVSLKLAERLTGCDVTLHIQQKGDHRMSSEESLALLRASFMELYKQLR